MDRSPQQLPRVGTPSGSWQALAVAEICSRDVQGLNRSPTLEHADPLGRLEGASSEPERAEGIDHGLHPLRAPSRPWRSGLGRPESR